MQRRLIPVLCVTVVVLGIAFVAQKSSLRAQDATTEPGKAVKPLMQMKLDNAKAILEGLTLEDYESVASNARQLKLLSMESGWNVLQTGTYRRHSEAFRENADLIVEAAEDRDINAAALGYVAMTVRCVECHNYMRKHLGTQDSQPSDTPNEK